MENPQQYWTICVQNTPKMRLCDTRKQSTQPDENSPIAAG